MTEILDPAAADATAADPAADPTLRRGQAPLLTRPLLLRFVSILGASTSFYLMLSVVPRYVSGARTGGGAAGLANGALLLACVVGELLTPRLVDRFGYRPVLAAGLALLGVPTLALSAFGGLWWIVAVCSLRGLGFAFTVVAGGALTASLIPGERRGEGLALVGVVSGVPSLLGLPLGVWLASHAGYAAVWWAAGLAPLAAIGSVPGLPDRIRTSGPGLGVRDTLRRPELLRPALVFAATTVGCGIMVTFLPLAVPARAAGVVAVALFVQPAVATLARWLGGRHGDRHGPAGLLLPGLLLAAAGTALMAATDSPVAVVAAVALFGCGFGITGNATSSLLYSRVPTAGYGAVSALWNFAYDGGMGLGALAFGWLSGATGYAWAFGLTALASLTALLPLLRDRTT